MNAEEALLTDWLADGAALDAATVDRRIAVRGLTGLGYYNGATHQAMLARPNFLRTLLA